MVNQSPQETALNRALIRWSLTKSTLLADTPTSSVYRVEQNGRNFAVLKIIKPLAFDEEKRGAALMEWYGGEGAATVFDQHANTVFMEWLDGIPLGDAVRKGHDEEATIALATVVSSLHRQRTAVQPELQPLRQRFQPLFDTDVRAWPHTARDLYARSTGVAIRLFDKPTAQIPLHGDLHHDNVISSGRGWLAIDPKGLLGDPAYELANLFRNPQGALELESDPRTISARLDILVARLGYPKKRVLGWAAAHAALSACWELEAGRPITTELAILPPLLAAYELA